MAARPQRSIRFDNEAYNGVLRVQLPGENFTDTINRVLLVGIDVIERELQRKPDEAKNEAQTNPDETQTNHSAAQDENTARYIQRLEDENARLLAEHEADRAVIAQALERAQELAAQSNHLAMMAQDVKQIPATTTGREITVVMDEIAEEPTEEQQAQDAEPVEKPRKRGLFSWLWE